MLTSAFLPIEFRKTARYSFICSLDLNKPKNAQFYGTQWTKGEVTRFITDISEPKVKDNQQTHLKGTSHSLHYTTQRTHARLFLERDAACLPSFAQPSGEY